MGMGLEDLASYVESMLTEMAREKVGLLLGVSSEIQSMENKLRFLKDYFADADRRVIADESVRDWVAQLKQIMYGATDIIDLCQHEAMERGPSATRVVRRFTPLLFCIRNPSVAHDIGSRIKALNQRLDAIMERSAAFNFLSRRDMDHGGEVHTSHPYNFKTSGELDRSDVVGEKIEEATEALVAEIIKTRNEVNNDIAVVAIVGVCGIGKTTLAQKVFNDEAIQGEFDKKIWLSINKHFNKADLLRTAITQAGGDSCPTNDEMDMLVDILADALAGKKVLLVMDDVWYPTAWECVLKKPFFNAAARGSRVLITTRREDVARRMRAQHPCHRVDKLGPEDAWSLMKKQIMGNNTHETELDELKDIGLQIIANCGGLPLAIKVMGGVLSVRHVQRPDWMRVLNDFIPSCELPEVINHSVYLSYEDLAPCLKQCFLHYSLLPTNAVFYENDIVGMWISEGFIHGNSHDYWRDSEDLGSEYYRELILRNLIEPDARYTSQLVCNMNDVVRSFAQSICRDEALVAHNGDMYGYLSSRKFYQLSLESKELESDMLVWSLVQEQTSLRTLVSIGQIKLKPGDSLMAFPSPRTLHIESTNAAVLVESLCQLKHLRYLSVAHTDVSSLPENINTMKFLQHINLQGCESFEKLPDSIIKLEQLRYLNLNDTGINVIPRGFCILTNLSKLYGFPAYMDGNWCSLEELWPLSRLKEIELKGLDNVAAGLFAESASLYQMRLSYLKLECSTRVGGGGLVIEGRSVFQDEENQRIEAVFDELHPPQRLSTLVIQGYFGLQLPVWMRTEDRLECLVVLTMEDLACCTQLPCCLSQLPYLEVLKIQRAPAISCVGPEFLGVSEHHDQTAIMFPRLHELVFSGMVKWEEWVWEKQLNAMPALEELLVDNCKLRSFPPGLAFRARALRRLVVTAAQNLNSLDSFASVVELDVYFSPTLTSIANLHQLQKLTIIFCPKLEKLIGVPAIRRLVLEDYDMETLPRYLQDVGNLSLLQLDCSLELLTSIAMGQPGPEWKKYSHVKHVEAYAHDGDNQREWYVLYTKDPYKFETNINQRSSKLAGEDKLIGKEAEQLLGIDSSSDSAVSEDNSELVGIENPCQSIIKLLTHGDEEELKMVSICGTGGLGKTTVAHAVYRKIANEFKYNFFVDMPRNLDIKVIIGTICAEVGCPRPKFEECGVQQLVDRLKIFFEGKRYLIVFDGLWTTSVWDQILPALKDNRHGSRIIITTRNVSIAEHVGGLYRLPLLSCDDSNMLFFRRTLFGSKDDCPSQFRELSEKMLSRCGQLPLAITVITDLLPKDRVLEEWQKVCDSIERGNGMENIRRVLKHSYDDLPPDLQRCLLCLSIFPEGYEIGRDSLVQRWMAEDLIRGKHGQNLQELGESYFSELVNSNMIQPIEFDGSGRDLVYRVPVTTLDLIVDLSIRENFVTILPSLQRTDLPSEVQRLSLRGSNNKHELKAIKNIDQVSSLSLFNGAGLMQPLSKFQGLQVLHLQKCDSVKNEGDSVKNERDSVKNEGVSVKNEGDSVKNEDLNGLESLDKLRYLVLGSSHITEIPKMIGKLRHLQILDLTATRVKELPSSIGKLTKLRRLLINRSTEVPDKIIGKLEALEELVGIDISKSPNILQEIGTMPELRVLSIALWSWDEHHTTLLSQIICKLAMKKLRHLSICSCCLLDLKPDLKPDLQPVLQLEKLEIQGSIFEKLPTWINGLTHLRSLSIEIYSLENNALEVLGELELLFLSLVAKRTSGEKLVIMTNKFCTLETFLLFSRATAIEFEQGAMEKLQRLKLTLQASLTKTDHLGLDTLSSLEHVQVEIICISATDGDVKVAEAAIRSMIGNNPRKPRLEMKRIVEGYMEEDKKKESECEIEVEDEDQEALRMTKPEEQTVTAKKKKSRRARKKNKRHY
ncbi:uncharacterized protein [Aegilops tauschii subsp. strangulata]|uniref:Uncharacterized protein n=2 Tax=Aegilops tauschii subsp. strangulata TaxID=200361 RepID=A0A453LZE3_AEGTS|nr:uncharacterized protein LOC109781738 isoform X5 [Aegilops tauschii subsp. strangulata]